MKRKFLTGFVFALVAALCLTLLFACAERKDDVTDETQKETGKEEDTAATYRTLEIQNGKTRTVKTYVTGETIRLKAELTESDEFVCWMSDGVPFSYERETTYEVKRDAVVKAIYSSAGKVKLETEGGVLPESYKVYVVVYGSDAVETDGRLYTGYGYKLPVPNKERYVFKGWSLNGTLVTDKLGVSLGGVEFDGRNDLFVAEYEEKPFVTIVLTTSESEERTEIKTYLEDGYYTLEAPVIADRECVGVYFNDEDLTKDSELKTRYEVDLTKAEAGKEYEYKFVYREAYRLTVISGQGSGAYELDEEVAISAQVPTGSEFYYWYVKLPSGDRYKLGTVLVDGEEKAALSDGTKTYVFVDDEVIETERPFAPYEADATIVLSELQKLGMPVSGGANTVITAEFKRKEFTVTYVVECTVNGRYCLDDDAERGFEEAGFVYKDSYEYDGKTYTSCYVKEEYYNKKELIVWSSVPTVNHYDFGNWQNAEAGESLPNVMPVRNICVKGTFTPKRHSVTVVSGDTARGTVRIFATGNATSGYFDYGSEIEFYAKAKSGYTFSRWLDVGDEDASGRIEETREDVGVDIDYVYRYEVRGDETFTIYFTEREYTVTYLLKVVYDGKDVTEDPEIFESGAYEEGYYRTTEGKIYNSLESLKPKVAIKGEETPNGLALLYGAQNWTVTDWKPEGVSIGNTSSFLMPKQDFTVTSTCEIKYYNVNFAKQAGTQDFVLETVNDNNSSRYVSEKSAGYDVPYGATLDLTVTYQKGYSLGNVGIAGGALVGDESGLTASETDNRYVYDVKFDMLVGEARGTNYLLYSTHNVHTISYYLTYDYEHNDEDNLLSSYVVLNDEDVKVVNGKEYYLVSSMRNGDGNMASVTVNEIYYGDEFGLFEPTVDASKERYAFGGWQRMLFNGSYTEPTMPDDNVWVYGDLSLLKYKVNIGQNQFRFDGQAGTPVDTAYIRGITEDGESVTSYDKEQEYLYFSAFTFKMREPTGYDYKNWQIKTEETGKETVTAVFDAENAQEGETQKVTVQGKTYKYINNGDGTITVFLTENMTVDALFEIQHFTATLQLEQPFQQGDMRIKTNQEGSQLVAENIQFDYGDQLTVSLNCGRAASIGRKITSISFLNTDTGEEIQNVSSDYDDDNLQYETSKTYLSRSSSVQLGEENPVDGFISDVTIRPNIESIQYHITYRVYEAALNLSSLTGEYTDFTADINGDPFTIEFSRPQDLLTDEEIKDLARSAGMNVNDVMYSGWWKKERDQNGNWFLSRTDEEGKGYKTQSASYNHDVYSYTHTDTGNHAYFCCYLVDMYRISTGKAALNPIIKDTYVYREHLGENYTELTVPDEDRSGNLVTALDDNAFSGVTSIKRVTMGANVTVIGESAFNGCTGLLETGITDKIATIGKEAYRGCTKIESVTMYNALESVGDSAFADTYALASVRYDRARTDIEIGRAIFRYAGRNVTEGVTLTIGNTTRQFPGTIFNAQDDGTIGATLRTVVIEEGEGTLGINANAFAGSGLKYFTASSRLKELGQRLFYKCNDLVTVDLEESSITEIARQAFESCGLKEIILPNGLTRINDYAFLGCTSLESVYYTNADGIAEVGGSAFRRGDQVNSQNLKRVTSIEKREAVQEDDDLYREIRLENVNVIGELAFDGATYVESVYLGGNRSTLGNKVFADATNLKTVYYNIVSATPKLVSSIMTFAEMRSQSGVALVIGEDVTTVSNYTFYGFDRAVSVNIPATITTIGTNAFASMTGLKTMSFDVDGSALTLSDTAYAFRGTGDDLVVTFGANVTSVKARTFANASGLKQVVFSEDATKDLTIERDSFSGSGLDVLTIPTRKKLNLLSGAFNNSPLREVNLSDDIAEVVLETKSISGGTNATTKLNAFGRVLNDIPAQLTSGTFTVTKSGTKYEAVLSGVMGTIVGDEFVLERTDVMRVIGLESSFTVNDKATIKGVLTKGGDGVITANKSTDDFEYFKAIAYDEEDFKQKNELLQYTRLVLDGSATVGIDDAYSVYIDTLEVNGALTMANGDIRSSTVVIGGSVVNGGKLSLPNVGKRLSGDVTISSYSTLLVNGNRIFNDEQVTTEDLQEANGYGLTITSGTATFRGTENVGYTYILGETTTVYAKYDVSLDGSTELVLDGATLETGENVETAFEKYDVSNDSSLVVASGSYIKFVGFTAAKMQGAVDSRLHSELAGLNNTVDRTYYGDLKVASEKGISEDGNTVLYVDGNIQTSEDIVFEYAFTMTFASGTYLQTTGKLEGKGKIELNGADIRQDGNAFGLNADEIVLNSGSIKAKRDALYALAITIKAGATVESESGTAVVTGGNTAIAGTVKGVTGVSVEMGGANVSTTVTGTVQASAVGIVGEVADSVIVLDGATVTVTEGDGVSVTGNKSVVTVKNSSEVTASGTAVKAVGKQIEVNVLSGSTAQGAVGVEVTENGPVDPAVGLEQGEYALRVGANATVTGQTVGIKAAGPGQYDIAGTVVASAARKIETAEIYGAIVAYESKAEEYYMQMTVSGTITNQNGGDAIVYVGYDGVDTSANAFAPITAPSATVTGKICEVMTCYDNATETAEYYSVVNGEMKVFARADSSSGNGRYSYVEHQARVQTAAVKTVTVDGKLDGFAAGVRVLTRHALIGDAMNEEGIIRTSGNASIVTDIEADRTVVISGGARLSVGEDITVSGTLFITNGILSVLKGMSVESGANVTNVYEPTSNTDTIAIGSGGTISLKTGATLRMKGENTTLRSSGRLEKENGATISFEGSVYFTETSATIIKGSFANTDNNGVGAGGLSFASGATLQTERSSASSTGDEIYARAISFGSGTYDINASLCASESIVIGDNVTLNVVGKLETPTMTTNDTFKLNLSSNVAGTRYDSEITGLGTSKEFRGELTMKDAFLKFGDSQVKIYASVDMTDNATIASTGGTITIYSEFTMDGSDGSSETRTTISADSVVVEESGRIVMKNYSALPIGTLGIKGGVEIMSYGFDPSGAMTTDGKYYGIDHIKVYGYGWMFVKDGITMNASGTSSPQTIENGTGTGYEERRQKAVGSHDETLGYIVTYYKTSDLSEWTNVAATCSKVGYTAPKATREIKLSSGQTVRMEYAAQAVVPASGEHSYTAKDENVHVCSVCGAEEPHVYSEALGQSAYFTQIDGSTLYVLAFVCSECEQSGALAIFDRNEKESDITAKGYMRVLSQGGSVPLILGTSNKKLSELTPVGTIEIDGTLFDIIKMTPVGSLTFSYGILIAHVDSVDADGYAFSGNTAVTDENVLVYGSENNGYQIVKVDLDTDSESDFTTKLNEIRSELGAGITLTQTTTPTGRVSDGDYELVMYNGKFVYLHDGIVYRDGEGTETEIKVVVDVDASASGGYGTAVFSTPYANYIASDSDVKNMTFVVDSTGKPVILTATTMADAINELSSVSVRMLVSDVNGRIYKKNLTARPAVNTVEIYNGTDYEAVTLGEFLILYSTATRYKAETNAFTQDADSTAYNIMFVEFAATGMKGNGVYAVLIPHVHPGYVYNKTTGKHSCISCGEEVDDPAHDGLPKIMSGTFGGKSYNNMLIVDCDHCTTENGNYVLTVGGTSNTALQSALSSVRVYDEDGNEYTVSVTLPYSAYSTDFTYRSGTRKNYVATSNSQYLLSATFKQVADPSVTISGYIIAKK